MTQRAVLRTAEQQSMNALAVVLQQPKSIALNRLELAEPGDHDVIVDMEWSGISGGTERLLWKGCMPAFPGMGYPLVPGYESVGRVAIAGRSSGRTEGERVFVGGANCYKDVRGLFGGAASRVVVPGRRAVPLSEDLAEEGVLLALAATASHAISVVDTLPDLIVGHGVLGRILARLACLRGGQPTVWETDPGRVSGAKGYRVALPADDARRDYGTICDASGDASIVDELIRRLKPGGQIVLAGFYSERISFDFPSAFMKEVRIGVAAEWQHEDLAAVAELAGTGRLRLDDLITHREHAAAAEAAYRTAFEDPACLKMILHWK